MNIAIVGTGYVGLVSGTCFSEMGINVVCVDIDTNKINNLNNGIIPIYEPGLKELVDKNVEAGRLKFSTDLAECLGEVEIVFIAVGTPPDEDGSADLKYVLAVAHTIGQYIKKYMVIVTKSTVPVGTARKVKKVIREEIDKRGISVEFDVASNPEFLKEGAAIKDFMSPDRVVIGVDSIKAREMMSKLYKPFMLVSDRIIITDIPSAEMIKYAANSMLATRISFMNDIANLCELVGADIKDVAEGMRYDERIGSRFLNAGIGYGGSCFPKDTKALKFLAREHGYQLRTVEACVAVNSDQKTRLFEKAKDRMISFSGLKAAVLGLTFKAGTDDLREAPSIDNIRLLLQNGADIYAYDPKGEARAKTLFPEGKLDKGTMNYVSSPEEALEGANICFVFTEWKEMKELTPADYKKMMHTPLVYDGRNLYAPEDMKAAGVEYYSIGR